MRGSGVNRAAAERPTVERRQQIEPTRSLARGELLKGADAA